MPDEYNSSYTGAEIDAAIGKARSIEANPTLAGTESSLTGLQIGSTKYKVDGGSGKADKDDLTTISQTSPTCTETNGIAAGVFFYLDNELVVAKTAIANGATFTLNTNYEYPSAGALNALKSAFVTPTETWSPTGFPNTQFIRFGRFVFFNIRTPSMTKNAWNTVFTVPSTFFPVDEIQWYAVIPGIRVYLEISGEFGIASAISNQDINCFGMYITA